MKYIRLFMAIALAFSICHNLEAMEGPEKPESKEDMCDTQKLKQSKLGCQTILELKRKLALLARTQARDKSGKINEVGEECRKFLQSLKESSILHEAIACRDSELVNLLLSFEVSPALLNSFGQNALHTALIHGNLNAANTLLPFLNLGELFRRDVHGYMPFDYALQRDDEEFVKEFVSHVLRSLGVAMVEGNVSSARVFLASCPEVVFCILYRKMEDGDVITFKEFLASYPQVINIRDGEGYTLLHYALIRGFDEIAQVLIESGADLDTAYERSRPSLAQLASPSVLISPRDFIRATGNLDLMRMLPS